MSFEPGLCSGDTTGYMRSRHDLDGTFLFASTTSTKILGCEASALVGKPLREVVAPDDGPLVDQALTRATTTEEPITVHCRLSHPTVAPRHIEMCIHGVRHPERGKVVEIHGIARDVTAAAETARREEQHAWRVRRLLDGVPGSVWGAWDADGSGAWRTQLVSEYAERLSGYTREEWLANPNLWSEIVHPDDQAAIEENNRILFSTGQLTSQMRWIRRDGRVIWVESHIRLISDENGAVIGMSGVTMDITARKEAEEAKTRMREQILAELSTPLIPIHEGVVVMPLIGALDRARAARVVEALLTGVTAMRARVAVLDITGVPAVDVEVADTLVRAAKGVRLLGAQVVLTGIRAEVAQAFVALGTDLQGIVTLGTLQAGVRYAVQRG